MIPVILRQFEKYFILLDRKTEICTSIGDYGKVRLIEVDIEGGRIPSLEDE